MKGWLLIGIGILLLYGCAEVKYVKGGATEADFEADKLECHNQVLMSSSGIRPALGPMGRPGPGQGIADQSAQQQARRQVEECLQSKGWVLETQTK
jgi:hypothetical protein